MKPLKQIVFRDKMKIKGGSVQNVFKLCQKLHLILLIKIL